MFESQEPDLKKCAQELLKMMGNHSDLDIRQQAWHALSNAAESQPELIVELLEHAPSSQTALQVLGKFVSFNIKSVKDHPNLAEILHTLTDLDDSHIRDLDFPLSRLIEAGVHDQPVYDCLTAWTIKHYGREIPDAKLSLYFEHSIMALSRKPLLDKLITCWLISDERVLGAAYSDLITHLWSHGVKYPVFARDILDTLDADDFKYLARRLIGWTIYEEALLSLTFSLLETSDAQKRVFGWVRALLVNDIGRNYPKATLKTIQDKLNGATPELGNR